ncbi:hypothetical protein PMAYCL1PPCAC_13671 [Pristionchus mayeri]|uniref:Uncharacterized protein n=1 Tax=Pristionchus mayeri TaxID=1317129 RepID=A0AAN5CHC1_9BILA|nr:hypothetical protein PMAYCL1PPCAC_13671 [Pristionchus mayeri]
MFKVLLALLALVLCALAGPIGQHSAVAADQFQASASADALVQARLAMVRRIKRERDAVPGK